MSRLRVGCVGTGFIAGRHLAALAGFPDVDIVAVADADVLRARETARLYGARCYDDGLALLGTEEMDAVWLCVPPFAHGPLEDAALDRDVPMFIEKPLAADLATAVRIGARVRERGLATSVGYHWRSLSVVKHAQRIVREAPARLVIGAWLDRTPVAPWWSQRGRSGGQLVEQTTHLVDLARLLVGEVDTVQAQEAPPTGQPDGAADVPAASAVLLRFLSGAVGTMSSSCVLDRRVRVGLQLVLEGRLLEVVERSLTDHELRILSGDVEDVVVTGEDPIALEDRSFLDALQGDVAAAPVPYEEALRTHAVVSAADRSAQEGGVLVNVAGHLARYASPVDGPAGVPGKSGAGR
jgi:myo-inositol 2-dehydrogenase/D-chiro-inositol 1-dehydrogenase